MPPQGRMHVTADGQMLEQQGHEIVGTELVMRATVVRAIVGAQLSGAQMSVHRAKQPPLFPMLTCKLF